LKENLRLVLIVEDDLAHMDLIVRGMKQIDKKVDHVVDGAAALDYLFRRGTYSDLKENRCPDLIILDLRIPKVNGLIVLEEIKTSDQLKKIPVIVLSSSESEDDIQMAYLHGANSYVVKSVDPEDFSRKIGCVEEYWLCENRFVER